MIPAATGLALWALSALGLTAALLKAREVGNR